MEEYNVRRNFSTIHDTSSIAKKSYPYPPADHEDRMHRHRHNGLYGATKMMASNLRNIIDSPTTTPHAKALATKMLEDASALAQSLWTHRVEPDGTVKQVNHGN